MKVNEYYGCQARVCMPNAVSTVRCESEITSNLLFLSASIQSETPFEGAYGNLKRLFDKAAKMYHQVKKQEMKKLSPSRQRSAFTPH